MEVFGEMNLLQMKTSDDIRIFFLIWWPFKTKWWLLQWMVKICGQSCRLLMTLMKTTTGDLLTNLRTTAEDLLTICDDDSDDHYDDTDLWWHLEARCHGVNKEIDLLCRVYYYCNKHSYGTASLNVEGFMGDPVLMLKLKTSWDEAKGYGATEDYS
jgi:hypothetical protein